MDAREAATRIVKTLVEAGYTAYFAGGWVRDYVLGHPTSDIDIATEASPDEVMALFSHTVPVGVAFGVVIVIIEGQPFEVSSFRRDGLYVDGRRPTEVAFSTPAEDAQRRDFTINGMFFDPLTETVHDFVGGREDLKKGVIKAIGNAAHRFAEDRLRMVRGVRLSARFGFPLDAETERAIQEQASTLLPAVAMERIWQEFKKMSDYPHLDRAILMMHRLGLLSVIFPELQNVSVDELTKRVASYEHFPENAPLMAYILELFPDLTREQQQAIAERLKVTNADIVLIERLSIGRDLVKRERTGQSPERVEWARFFVLPDSEMLISVVVARDSDDERGTFLSQHEGRRRALGPHVRRMQEKRPLVTSQMLQQEGIPPGKKMGALLKEAERMAINEDLHDGAEVLHLLKKHPLWTS